MKAKPLTFQRLPMMLTVSVMSTGLLLSGCSNSADSSNDSKTDSVKTDSVKTDSVKTEKVTTDSPVSATETVSKTINPTAAAAKQPSLLTNPTEAGTAEDTVRLALDTLYYGDAKKAAAYYQVDMANFEEELKNTQFTFQQTVDSVTIIETKYNKEKTRATVIGELKLKNQSEPAPLSYILQKIDGQWKILG